MPSAEAAAAFALDDAFAPPAPPPTLASAPGAAAAAALDSAFGWTRKGIVLINDKTGEKVPVQQWPAAGPPAISGPEPTPDAGIWTAAQGAATRSFGLALAGAAESIRDFVAAHPALASTFMGVGDVPQGLTADLAAKAEAQRQAYLAAHPGTGGAAAEFAAELGTNLLPMAAGVPAAARSAAAGFTGLGAAPTLASVGRGAAVGLGTGAPMGYSGAYGAPTGERLRAAAVAGGLGLAMGGAAGGLAHGAPAPEGADFSPIARALNEARAADQAPAPDAMGQPPPSQLYRQAQDQAQARAAASLPQDATPERVQAATQAEMAKVDDLWRESTGMAPPGSPEAQATHAALAARENAPRYADPQYGPLTPGQAAAYRSAVQMNPTPVGNSMPYRGTRETWSFDQGMYPRGTTFEDAAAGRVLSDLPADLPVDRTESNHVAQINPAGGRAPMLGEPERPWPPQGATLADVSPPPAAGARPGYGSMLPQEDAAATWMGRPPAPPPQGAPEGINPEAGFLRTRSAPTPEQLTDDFLYDDLRHPFVTRGNRAEFTAGVQSLEDAASLGLEDADRGPQGFATDARHMLEGSKRGNPNVSGDTPEALQERLAQDPRTQGAIDLWNQWQQEAAGKLEDINAMRAQQGLEPVPARQNYLTLRFQDDEPWVQPEGPRIASGKIGPEQERTYPTLADAMNKGKVPVPGTEDLVGAIRASRESYGKALAMRELLGKVEDLATKGPGGGPMEMPDGNPALLRGYEPPKGFQRADQVRLLSDLVPGDGNLYVHPDLWKNLKPIITGTDVGRLGEAYDAINETEKQAELFMGIMHPWALGESSVAMDPNPLQGLVSAVKAQGQAAGQLLSHVPGLQRLAPRPLSAAEQATALRYIDAGGNIHGAPIEGEAQALAKTLAGVQRWGEGTQGAAQVLGKPVAWTAQALNRAHELNSEYLWHELRPRLQIAAFARNEAALKAVHSGQSNWALGVGGFARRNAIRAQSLEQGMRGVANAVGNGFGAQEWRLHRNAITSDPAIRQALARGFLSPEWNISSAKMFASPFSKNPVESAMGINYHINHGLMFGAMQLLSQATAGHYTWQNGPGGTFDPYKLSHLQWRNPLDGKLYETNVGKHYLELAHGIAGRSSKDLSVVGPLTDKLAPVPGSLLRAAEAAKPQRGEGRAQRAGDVTQNLAAPLVPISLRTGWHNQPGAQRATPGGSRLDLGAWLAGLLAPGPTTVVH